MNAALPTAATLRPPGIAVSDIDQRASMVAGATIFAGAVGAVDLSFILPILGTGPSFSPVPPWAGLDASAITFGVSTFVWLTLIQLAPSNMGGHPAGRLCTQWAAVHTNEIYSRDSAHGFLVWAVATLVTASLLSSVIRFILCAGTSVEGGAVSTAATGAVVAGTAAVKSE